MNLRRFSSAANLLVLLFTLVLARGALADSNWSLMTGKDELTGQESVGVKTDSLIQIPLADGSTSVRPSLVIRCKSGQTTFLVDWWRFISNGDEFTSGDLTVQMHIVKYRIDDGPISEETWIMSTDFQATIAWYGSPSPQDLVLRLLRAHQIVFETLPFGDNPVQAKFNVDGLDKVIGKVASACQWSNKLPPNLR